MPSTSDREAIGFPGLVRTYMACNLRRSLAFPTSLALEQLSYMVQLVLSILLWKLLFTRLPRLSGWTFDGILVLHLFGNLFVALFHSLFQGFHTFHSAIRTGAIDAFLSRPVDPRLAHLACQFQPQELLNRLLGLIPLVLFIRYRGASFDPAQLMVGLAAMSLGLATFACGQLTMTYAAFWLVRGDAILAVLDLFYGFYRFPLDAIPFPAQLAVTVVAPVILAVTYPAMYAAGILSAAALARAATASLVLLAIWMALQERLWRSGLAAYQSPGG